MTWPRWKTLRTIWICRTLALLVSGATPVAAVQPTVEVAAQR
ncbi:MAG: hypothetical protein NW200_15160 [Hyphomonadaceae bacterium]|nr:hypothetical protein [Hyphomonadaceae bacterium]